MAWTYYSTSLIPPPTLSPPRCASALAYLRRLDSLDVLIPVQLVVVDILYHAVGQQVLDAHAAPYKQADFGGRDIVVDELFDDDDVSSKIQLRHGAGR